jgi:hypothetical protein
MPTPYQKSLRDAHPDKILASFDDDRDGWYEGECEYLVRDALTDAVMCHQMSSWSMPEEPICPMDGIADLRKLLGSYPGETIRESVERLLACLTVSK